MPYKSLKQERYFHAAEKRGDTSPKLVNEFDKTSKGLSLPKAINKKKRDEHAKKMWRGGKA